MSGKADLLNRIRSIMVGTSVREFDIDPNEARSILNFALGQARCNVEVYDGITFVVVGPTRLSKKKAIKAIRLHLMEDIIKNEKWESVVGDKSWHNEMRSIGVLKKGESL